MLPIESPRRAKEDMARFCAFPCEVWRIFEIAFTVFFIGEIFVKIRVFGGREPPGIRSLVFGMDVEALLLTAFGTRCC